MRFEFATAARILYGPGTVAELPDAARQFGSRPLVVTNLPEERLGRLLEPLQTAGLRPAILRIQGEPTVQLVREGVELARQERCDCLIGCGGGSAIDAAKAVAAILGNGGDPLDYLEVIGQGKPLKQPSLPTIAVPTTAGTGAEVTRNAVLGSPEHRVKASLRSPLMLPKLALVDPELTYDLPREITFASGLDALTQLIEPFVSVRANPLTDAICLEGMRRAARALPRLGEELGDREARNDMALASLFSGLALANAALGAVHGLAAPLGGRYSAPHGAICAALLPHVLEVNIRALRQRDPSSEKLERYRVIAQILTGDPAAEPEQATEWLLKLYERLGVPGLRTWRVQESDFEELAAQGSRASSMKGNPIALTVDELKEILRKAL